MATQPIDYVVAMVNPSDPLWLRDYQWACRAMRLFDNDKGMTPRFRSWGIERYHFRAVAKNLPFVRKFHLLVSRESQVPKWVDPTKVNIVLHSDIMPQNLLPTFNSSAFELFINNIPELSELFLYGNDDMLPLTPMRRTEFFKGIKPICRHFEKPQHQGVFHSTIRNALELAADFAGVDVPKGVVWTTGHSVYMLRRSVIAAVWQMYGKRLIDSCTQFRSSRNINGYVWQYVAELCGQTIEGLHEHKYISMAKPIENVMEALAGTGYVCINDAGDGDFATYRDAVCKALEVKFPEPCKYER